MKKHNIIISTDIGTDIDDAVSLYLCTQIPQLNLKGVYVTNGNLDHRSRVAKKLLNLAKHDVEVGIGEEYSLTRTPPYHTCFEKTYLTCKEREKSLKSWRIKKDGISSMEKKLQEPDTFMVSIAPLTNIARLLENNSRLRRRIYIMGGRENEVEHNFRYDVEAARQVFASELDICVVPADVCDRYKLDTYVLCDLNKSPETKYIAKMAEAWKVYHEILSLINPSLESILKEIEFKNPHFHVPGHIMDSLSLITHYNLFAEEYSRMLQFYKIFKEAVKSDRSSLATKLIGDIIKERELKKFSISDAYTIYALVHPDKTKTKKVNISIEKEGVMKVKKGDKHELVTEIDYEDFDRFLRDYLK